MRLQVLHQQEFLGEGQRLEEVAHGVAPVTVLQGSLHLLPDSGGRGAIGPDTLPAKAVAVPAGRHAGRQQGQTLGHRLVSPSDQLLDQLHRQTHLLQHCGFHAFEDVPHAVPSLFGALAEAVSSGVVLCHHHRAAGRCFC